MNAAPSFLLKWGPLVFYLLELPVWLFLALPNLAGVDIRKVLGLLGVVATPLYGLFILASLGAHIFFLVAHRYQYIKLLLLANVVGIVSYMLLTVSVVMWGLYR